MAALLQPLVPANALIATFCRSLRIAEVEECFPCNPVVRIYLNLSIISGTGSGAFCCGSKTPEDTETIGRFLVESFGEAIEVDSEAELESVSRITHAMTCGTYLSMQCHMYSAVRAGYPMEQARKIAISAFRGAAETFRQEQDVDGKLSTLCAFLDGRGIRDLEIAWQELRYKELYESFSKVFVPGLEDAVRSLLLTMKELRRSKIRRANVNSICALVEENLLSFYEIANKTISASGKRKIKRLASPKTQFAQFKRKMAHIVRTATEIRKNSAVVEKQIALSTKSPKTFLAGGILSQNEGLLFAVVYSMVADLALRGAAKEWALYRKISEFLKNANVSEFVTYNFFERAFTLAAKKQPTFGETEKEAKANSIVARNIAGGDDAGLLVGANEYDGTVWFKSELMDSSIFIAHEILLLGAGKKKSARILKMFDAISSAKDASEFKLGEFLKEFPPVIDGRKTRRRSSK